MLNGNTLAEGETMPRISSRDTLEDAAPQAEKKSVKIFQDQQSQGSQRTTATAKSRKVKVTAAQKKAVQQAKELKKRRSVFLNTTRWLPDSAFTTYFGKPAFHTYGRANTNPTVGGINYGQTLLTHNINAECGDNPPFYQQVYEPALKAGIEKTKGYRVPHLPLFKNNAVITQ